METNKAAATTLIGDPPDNCYVCAEKAAQDFAQCPQAVDKGSGVAFGGHVYHLNDFALVESEGGLCLVGQIIKIDFASQSRGMGSCTVTITVFERVSSILSSCPGDDIVKDEVGETLAL